MKFQFNPLPEGFIFGKPQDQKLYTEQIIYDIEKKGDLIITRKRDGWKLYVVIDAKNIVTLYTAGNNPVDERCRHIKEEVKSLHLPSRTLLVGEGVLADADGNDYLGKVQSMMQKNFSEAMALQEEYGYISLVLFGKIFYGGKNVLDQPYHEILDCLTHKTMKSLQFISSVERLHCSFDDAKAQVKKKKWEGLVLYDRNFQNSFRLDGKAPKRPKGCYKWKPSLEDDFIIREWISHPDDLSRLKDVVLLQIDPDTGEEFECGRLGTFKKEIRMFLENASYPIVMQVEFEKRYDSRKLRSKRFVRIRYDKALHECIGPSKK